MLAAGSRASTALVRPAAKGEAVGRSSLTQPATPDPLTAMVLPTPAYPNLEDPKCATGGQLRVLGRGQRGGTR